MKNKLNIVLGLFVMAAFTLGLTSFVNANTYNFIDTSGQIQSIVANTPEDAIRDAYQRGATSGVILVDHTNDAVNNNNVVVGQGNNLYQFIDTSGQLKSVRANSAQEALRTAYQLGVHSGVILR